MSNPYPLPAPVERQLQAVRRVLRAYLGTQTLLLIACWLLIVFWAGGLLDYLPVRAGSSETPRWLRAGLLAAMFLGSFWILLRWALPRWLTPVRDRSLALLIERSHPDLNNELVTAVELSALDHAEVSNPAVHEAMLDRVRHSVASRIEQVVPTQLFNWQPIWGTATVVAFGILVTAITAIAMPQWMGLWAERLFTLSDRPWPRAAELRADGVQVQFPTFTSQLSAQRVMLPFNDDGIVHVPAGATALLQVSANARAKKVPEVCTLYYRSADGTRGRANLRRVGAPRDGWQHFTLDGSPLDGISEDIELDVVGLDARLRNYRLEVVEPAVVSDLQLVCSYPSYLLDSLSSRPAQETLNYRAGMRIPEGTQLTLLGRSNSELSQVEYVVRQSSTASSSSDTAAPEPTIQSTIPQGNEFRIELGELRKSQVVELRLIDAFGLPSDQILRYALSLREDTPPEVESTLAGIGTAITPNALLPIRGSVSDDNGVARVVVELALNDSAPLAIPLTPDPDGQLESDVDLAKLTAEDLAIEPESTLGLVVTARDHFDLDGQEHVGRGQPQQLAVVTADQLLVILDRQELELRQRLEIIIVELQQVNSALELLGSSLLPAADAAGTSLRPTRSVAEHWSPTPAARVEQSLALARTLQDPAQEDSAEARAQRRRMAALRAQQSQLQSDKSEQELVGVAKRVDNLRLQLLNNRIDSYDRQNRLQSKVHEPLLELLGGDYRTLSRSLSELQTATMSDQGFEQTQASLAALAKVIDALEAIKSNMLDIESFNEIVDLVRSLLEDQDSLLNEAEKQQKARILDLLK